MQEKLKCAIYTRVSTDNQAEVEFNSCEAQEAKIKSFIQSQENMEIFKVYSDPGYTGANLNRPALTEMLNDIKARKISLVISYKIDRLTRSPKDFYQLIELFEKYGVDFISVTERFDTSTPSGRLLRNIMLTFAQFERELASERTKDKMLQRAQKGMWNGGLVPFGYKAENKKLVINDDAKIVRSIYESYITDTSIAKISKDLGLSKSRIFTILRNPIYIGKIKYAGKFSQGNHSSLISEDIFILAQEIHRKQVRKLRLYKDYLLAGLIRCKECGSHMTPCHTNKNKKSKMRRYYYYRCTSTFKRDWNNCQTRQVNANRLEDYIFKNLERISHDKHYLDSLIFRLKYTPAGDRIGLEPSQSCSESAKISVEIFVQTLQHFVKVFPEKKGIEKNLWAKKFIKNIDYSKEEIAVILYYKRDSEDTNSSYTASGCPHPAACRNSISAHPKKITPISTDRGNHQEWLPRHDGKRNTQPQVIQLLVKMYIRKGRRNSINLGRPFPKEPERPQPVYKNIIIEALRVQAFLEETPSRTQTDAGQHFNVTRARISQLAKIVNNLPDDFIEKMRECEDRSILKTFSGKTLLKIAKLSTLEKRQAYIKSTRCSI